MVQSVDGGRAVFVRVCVCVRAGVCVCVCVRASLLCSPWPCSGISQMMYFYIQAFLESAAHVCKEDGQLATCTCLEHVASRVNGKGTSCRSGHCAPPLWQRLLL